MPLDFMLAVMRDEMAERSERLDMAKAAAPYVHAKLSSIEATVDTDVTWFPSVVEFVSPDASAD
jgi:DNA-binding ferritin-like protein